MRIRHCAAKHNVAYACRVQIVRHSLQKSRAYNASAAIMDQHLRASKLLDQVSCLTFRILSENNLRRGEIMKSKHVTNSFLST